MVLWSLWGEKFAAGSEKAATASKVDWLRRVLNTEDFASTPEEAARRIEEVQRRESLVLRLGLGSSAGASGVFEAGATGGAIENGTLSWRWDFLGPSLTGASSP